MSRKHMKGRYAYDGLQRVMHEKARLGILTTLLANPEGVLFTDLKGLCSLTDGNLSRHLKALATEQLVELYKRFHERRPQTLVRLSEDGRTRFLDYLEELQRVVRDAALARRTENKCSRRGKSSPAGEWIPV